jgi:hypothetical protein
MAEQPGSGGSDNTQEPPARDGEQGRGDAVRTALISGNTFFARPVRYVEVDGWAMFEGDIVLGTVEEVERTTRDFAAQIRGEVAAGVSITGAQFRWPNCQVPFDIDAALPSQNRVTDAIAHWEAHTGFRFVLRNAANAASFPDWVTFQPSSGCSSSVGRRGGQQFVNLGPSCTTGNAIHEIGHTIGLWHEQSREDRDAFVTVHFDKIQAGREHNFDQHIVDGDDVGGYDYGSIMHYPRDAFSVDGSDTITPVDPAATIGQRTALSPGDIAAAATLCSGGTTIVETVVETLKERNPETVKEFLPETLKERTPETIKELSPETTKERIPETIKERIPETIKENVETGAETLVEGLPRLPGIGRRTFPAAGGNLPFAMVTPQTASGPGAGAAGQGAADDPSEGLLARLADLDAVLAQTGDQYAALAAEHEQVLQALYQLGWQ